MSNLKTTARITGLLYLGLGITGMLGFLTLRPMLYDPADATVTLANLVAQQSMARLTIALELGVVLTQALVAIWFYRLFRSANGLAAGAIAGFGMMNAAAIMASSAFLATALEVAINPNLGLGQAEAGVAQLMFTLSAEAWSGGALFFGLWLIPMGYAVLISGWMPRLLGHVLIYGGAGYVLSTFVPLLVPQIADFADVALVVPATIGEFWMIGYLLTFGVRAGVPEAGDEASTAA